MFKLAIATFIVIFKESTEDNPLSALPIAEFKVKVTTCAHDTLDPHPHFYP